MKIFKKDGAVKKVDQDWQFEALKKAGWKEDKPKKASKKKEK